MCRLPFIESEKWLWEVVGSGSGQGAEDLPAAVTNVVGVGQVGILH